MKSTFWIAASCAALILSGCSSVKTPAPIEDRTGTYDAASKAARVHAESIPVDSSGVVEVAPRHLATDTTPVDSGRVHVVSAGDTLYNIGVRYGVNPRELQKLNDITDPTALSIGQELRIPGGTQNKSEEAAPSESSESGVTASPTDSAPLVQEAVRPATAEEVARKKIAEQEAIRKAAAQGDMHFIWPAKGDVISTFKENKMGIDIAGTLGDPVYVVLDGTVQYVGSNAPGYGKFLIVRHNIRLPGKGNTPLITVYGNTSKILVRVNERVRAGQQIAEMGKTDADRVKLRFEVRQGKPLDPIPYLSE